MCSLSVDYIPYDDDGVGTIELEYYDVPEPHSVRPDSPLPSSIKTCCNANRTASFRLFCMSVR